MVVSKYTVAFTWRMLAGPRSDQTPLSNGWDLEFEDRVALPLLAALLKGPAPRATLAASNPQR
jgi:hypothetical protein